MIAVLGAPDAGGVGVALDVAVVVDGAAVPVAVRGADDGAVGIVVAHAARATDAASSTAWGTSRRLPRIGTSPRLHVLTRGLPTLAAVALRMRRQGILEAWTPTSS